MTDFFVYLDSGVIVRTGTAPESMVDIQAQPDERVKAGSADQATQYVIVDADPANDELADKQAMPATIDKTTITADGVDAVTISAPAVPLQITLSGPMADAWSDSDGSIQWATNMPGEYTLRLSGAVEYLDASFDVTAS